MKLIALSPIEHDGVAYAIGDDLDVKDKVQAEALVSVGSAVVAGTSKAAKALAAAQAAVGEAEAALAAAEGDAKVTAQAALDKAVADLADLQKA